MKPTATPKLIYSKDADWRYATGMDVSDPHLCYIDSNGKSHGLVGPLEFAIAQRESYLDHLHSYEELGELLKKRDAQPSKAEYAYQLILTDPNGLPKEIDVAEDFPSSLFSILSERGFKLTPQSGSVFPNRAFKTDNELEKLRHVQQVNTTAFHYLRRILAASKAQPDGTLIWQGNTLTSEIAQAEMNKTLLDGGCTGFNGGPIVASAAQGAVPHERGSGPIQAGELIVVDCFPQHSNFYNGDLTRTFIKGKPSNAQYKLYDTVRTMQAKALEMIAPQVDGATIHKAMVDGFAEAGYATGKTDDEAYYGYFHGTGHAVGLEVHDPATPRISQGESILQPGHVVTVEPGLYYPPSTHNDVMGGVRIEDIVTITENGMENITDLPKDDSFWIIS